MGFSRKKVPVEDINFFKADPSPWIDFMKFQYTEVSEIIL